MRTEETRPVRLEDYRPPDWLVETVELDVTLDPTATRVRATLALEPNGHGAAPAPLVLDGEALSLTALEIDGVPLPPEQYVATAARLTIAQPPHRAFRLQIETTVDPSANTQLSGLYRSGSIFCTQCEAEGFRRITYFPDRPDVMAVYTTRIEAEKGDAPVLLANGNLAAGREIAVGEQHRRVAFLGFDAGGVDRHHVGAVGEIGDAAEALGLALGAKDRSRAIKARELGVGGGIDGGLDLQPERPVRRLRDGQPGGRCDVLLGRKR